MKNAKTSHWGGKARNLHFLSEVCSCRVPPYAIWDGFGAGRVLDRWGWQELSGEFDARAEAYVRAELEGRATAEAETAAVALSSEWEERTRCGLGKEALKEIEELATGVRLAGVERESILAVRSSADVEDSEGTGFHGQFETVLGVRTSDEIVRAVQYCLANLLNPRNARYRLVLRVEECLDWTYGYRMMLTEWRSVVCPARPTPLSAAEVQTALDATRGRSGTANGTSMSLILQELVPAVAAGVAFSPADDAIDSLLVQGVPGLGETLVNAEATPDTWRLAIDTFECTSVTPGSKSTKHQFDGQVVRRVLCAPQERDELCLSRETAVEIAREVRRIHLRAGWGGADVEWAFDGTNLWILQARPQTARHALTVLTVTDEAARGPVLFGPVGETASSGAAHGRLLIANGPRDVPSGATDFILVAPATEKEWENAGALLHARAVLVEEGGQLSHAACYCREHGLPCLVGASGARAALAGSAGAEATLDASRRLVLPGRLELSERRIVLGGKTDLGTDKPKTKTKSRWHKTIDGRSYLIRVRSPFGARFVVDSYVAAFTRLDRRFGCRHNVVVEEDGGVYTPAGARTGLGAALRAMSLAETDQLLQERHQARDRFLVLSARAASQFDVKAWNDAHVALVVFQHLSFPWAQELDNRFERATARLDPTARALLLTAERCPDPTESVLAEKAFDAICAAARGVCMPRDEDPGQIWDWIQANAGELACEIRRHAALFRHDSADPSHPLPVLQVVKRLATAAFQPDAGSPPSPRPVRPPADWEMQVDDPGTVRRLLRIVSQQQWFRESEHHYKYRGLRQATAMMLARSGLPEDAFFRLTLEELLSLPSLALGTQARDCAAAR